MLEEADLEEIEEIMEGLIAEAEDEQDEDEQDQVGVQLQDENDSDKKDSFTPTQPMLSQYLEQHAGSGSKQSSTLPKKE